MQVQEELVEAIKDAEDGLFQLKRARLLREVDSVAEGLSASVENAAEVEVEPLDLDEVEPESLEEEGSYYVGSKCKFRHTDGRWYDGIVVALDEPSFAKIAFLTPTSENMLVCGTFKDSFVGLKLAIDIDFGRM